MAEVGDILKFEKPLMEWHKKYLEDGAVYVVEHFRKVETYQTSDGVWHFKELEGYDPPKVFLKTKNGAMDCGELSQYKNYEVVGRIEK